MSTPLARKAMPTERPARPATFGERLVRLAWALLISVSFSSIGCTTAPDGPAYARAPDPPPHRGRVYVYRNDTRRSLAQVRLTIDGQPLAMLRDREYQTVELRPGTHQLRAQLRGLGMVPVPLGWNGHRFELEAGDTVFLELQVRIESTRGSPPSLEIGGRSNDVLRENVYILEQGASQAERDLKITTRAVGRD